MNPLPLAGPSVEPITLARMRAYLRLDGTEEDDLVTALVVAGRVSVERQAGLALIEQSWQFALTAWPKDRAIRLPLHPVLRIAELRVFTEDGPVIVAPDSYRIEMRGDVAWLVVAGEAPEPGVLTGRIEIDIVCGFGPDPADVPEPLILADAALAELMDPAIHDEAPRGKPPVYATFGEVELTDASSSTETGHEQEVEIAIWSRRGSAAAGLVAADRMAAICESASLTLLGHHLVSLTVTGIASEFDEASTAPRVSLRLRVVTETSG